MGKRYVGGEMLTNNEDLLTEVLSRLPVKILLQCKAVSKTWYSLISSPSFIKSHYQHAMTTNIVVDDNELAATLIVRRFKDEDLVQWPEEDGSYSLLQLGGSDDFVAHLKYPFSRGDYSFLPPSLLVGCVCGIVCVCVDPFADSRAIHCLPTSHKPTDIYIWNPATRQSKLIPPYTLHDCDPSNEVALGFGFDPIDLDFKVVRVVSRDIFPEIYSANRDAWRNIETKLSDVPRKKIFNICLHGFLFATGYNGMMAFNLNREVFICDIKLPISSNDPDNCNDAQIADFRDSIAVIISNCEELSEKINLWTLDDEACLRGGEVKASWTCMLSINVDERFDDLKGLFNNVEFYLHGLFNNVEFLLAADDWFSYNSDKEVLRSIYTNPFFDFDEVFKYTESQQMLLVSGSKIVNWSDDEDHVSMENSVYLEDDYEDCNEENHVDSEDDNEESSTADSEDNEKSNSISQNDDEDKNSDSGSD